MEKIIKHITFTVINDLTLDQRMIRTCSTLSLHGYTVTLIGRKLQQSYPASNKLYTERRVICFFNKGPLFYIEYQIRLFFVLLFTKSDMYVAVDLDTLLPNTLVALIKSRKLALDAHEYFTEVPEVQHRKWVKACWHAVAKICLPATSLRYTVSQSLAQELERVYRIPFAVVRNTPFIQPEPQLHPSQKSIIYQGDLNPGRGIELCIQALTKLPDDVQLHIAGSGPLMHQLQKLTEHLNLKQRVVFHGYLDPAKLHQLTAQAWLGINLLDAASKSYYYSLSNKFFNYVQARIPQLCSPLPEYTHLNAQHQVALMTKYNNGDVCNAIHSLLTNTTLYETLKTNTQIAALSWNWENEKQTLISLYEQTLAHR